MFFDVKVVIRIYVPLSQSTKIQSIDRQKVGKGNTHRKGEEFGDQRDNVDGRITQREELVHAGSNDGPNDAENPHAQSVDRDTDNCQRDSQMDKYNLLGIIRLRYHSADFGVWRSIGLNVFNLSILEHSAHIHLDLLKVAMLDILWLDSNLDPAFLARLVRLLHFTIIAQGVQLHIIRIPPAGSKRSAESLHRIERRCSRGEKRMYAKTKAVDDKERGRKYI